MARGDSGPDSERLVYLRFRGPARPMEVRGDFIHFYHPLELTPGADGVQEVALRLPPGVYQYKFRAPDGTWHLDPDNPRTCAWEGRRNNLLSLGGADEPVLHAPVRPFVFVRDDGRLCVRAGLRRGAGGGLTVRWHEERRTDTPMRLVAEEDEHLLFEALLPASQRAVEYLFVLPGGALVGAGASGAAFRVVLREARLRTPAWWRDAVVYTVLIDRFRRGAGPFAAPPSGPVPHDGLPPPWWFRADQARRGGDLLGVQQALPYLQDLGVTVLHLTPVVLAPSAHRYDGVDPRQVDPALGGEPALRQLLDEAHRLGLRVLLDLGLTHVHRDFFAFRDVRQRGPASPYWSWFHARHHPFIEGPSPGYDHYQNGQWYEPLLNLESADVAEYLEGTVRRWMQVGADGMRIDQAAEVPLPLLQRLRRAVLAERADAVLLGEVVPDNLHRFTAAALDSATDFTVAEALRGWLGAGRGDARQLGLGLARRGFWRGGPGWTAVGFTATHDQQRLATLCQDPRAARLAQLIALTRPEVPAVLYGDEVGVRAPAQPRDFEDVWPDRQVMPWDPAAWDGETRALLQQAIRLRRSHPALRTGDDTQLPQEHPQVLAYRRQAGHEVIEIYAHGGPDSALARLAPGAPVGATVLLSLGAVELRGGELHLGPYAGVVLARHPSAAALSLWQQVTAAGPALADVAFVRGQVEVPVLPAHLYLTVTEACNLRCRHCITDAPARTASGQARVMQPWLIDALGEALGAATYFGFAHGGESLAAPILWDLLAAIQQARAGRPYDVHLLTNGMLLTPAVTHRLIDLGVNSLAVSLDGASAATNDAVRVGSRLQTVAEHVRAAIDIRRARRADLRVGISAVVTRDNVAELAALGRLSAELQIDWLKLEELFPVNGFCRLRVVGAREPAVQAGLDALRAEVGDLVIVDHLDPPGGCPCEAEQVPGLAAFRAADDFANRARFRPCSLAWEQACVDPDGAVRPVDYYQPPLGNLADAPLLDLWNSPAAQRLRAQALSRVPAARRRGCPHRART